MERLPANRTPIKRRAQKDSSTKLAATVKDTLRSIELIRR
jgi:hypothetical protein